MDEAASNSQADTEATPQPMRTAPPLPQPLPSLLQSFSPPKQERTLLHDYSHIYMDSSGEEDNIPVPHTSAMRPLPSVRSIPSTKLPSSGHRSVTEDSRGTVPSNSGHLDLPSLSQQAVEDMRAARSRSLPKERPPMTEVLLNQEVEPNENDTFSEDRSLETKVRRSVNVTPATPPRLTTPRRNFYRRAHPPSISPGTKKSPDNSEKNVNGASPAWVRMKNEVQATNEKMAKVEKENAKLAETCKALTEELQRLNESSDQSQALHDELDRVKRTVDLLSYQNKQLSKEKRALMFGARQFDEDKTLLVEARQAAERSELEAIEENNALEEQLRSTQSELKAMKDERDRIASELKEAIQSKVLLEQEKADLVVRMNAATEEVAQLTSPAEATSAAAAASKAEANLRRKIEVQKREIAQLKAALEEERTKSNQLLSSSAIHQAETQALRKETESLKREVSNLRSTLMDPEDELSHKASDDRDRMEELEEANNLMKLEIVQLTAELEDVNLQSQTFGRTASKAEAEMQSLLDENESLRSEVAQMTATTRETIAKVEKLSSEKNDLESERESLQRQVRELSHHHGHKPPVTSHKPLQTAEAGTQTDYSLQPTSPPRQRLNSGSPSVSSLSERIDRIRDSAERATLIRDHQREILHLKKEHDAEISRLRGEHDSLIRRLAKEAKAEMDVRNKDLQRRLEGDYEKKMAELVRHHEKEVAKLQTEMKNGTLNAEESVQAAMSKVASTMQRLERETKKREALEQTLDQIHVEHNAEYQKILELHRQELELLRDEWEEDKNTLLSMVQSECNLVFDRNKALSRSSIARNEQHRSPSKHSNAEAMSSRRAVESNNMAGVESLNSTPTSNGGSLLSQINRDLYETENLVKGLVGGVSATNNGHATGRINI